MPIRDTRYSFRFPHPDLIVQAAEQVLYVESRVDGAISAPTAAGSTCTVKDQNGDTVKTGAITVTDDLATFTLDAVDTANLTLSTKWRVEWSLVMDDGRTYAAGNQAGLVIRKLYPVLTDEDLTEGMYSDLNRYLPSGSTSWQTYRDNTWDEIQRVLFRDERRPQNITEPSAFLDPHRELTLARIFRMIGMTQRTSDRDWLGLANLHEAKYQALWRSMSFDYAETSSGQTSTRQTARPILVLGAVGAAYRR